jgi:hypothetical protein
MASRNHDAPESMISIGRNHELPRKTSPSPEGTPMSTRKNQRLIVEVDFDDLIEYLDHDRDYIPQETMGLLPSHRVYINRTTRKLVCVFEDEGARDEGDTTREHVVAEQPEALVEIPIPNHAMRHKWFQSFLRSRSREGEYFGSIGGWLKERADEEDRRAWNHFRQKSVGRYAISVAKSAGIILKVTQPLAPRKTPRRS